MAKKLFVGNLPWKATEEELTSVFEEYGNVISLKLIHDRETGRLVTDLPALSHPGNRYGWRRCHHFSDEKDLA